MNTATPVLSRDSYTDYYWPRRLGLLTHLTGGVLAAHGLGLLGRATALCRAADPVECGVSSRARPRPGLRTVKPVTVQDAQGS